MWEINNDLGVIVRKRRNTTTRNNPVSRKVKLVKKGKLPNNAYDKAIERADRRLYEERLGISDDWYED